MSLHHLRSAALLLVVALTTSGCTLFGRASHYEVQAEFARTFNLFPGSPVRVLGLDVGKVKDVDVRPGAETVTATLLVDDHVRLPEDVGAIIITGSLLGERYVQLEPPYVGDGATFEAGGTIPRDRTHVPFEFDEVLEGLNRFVGGLDGPEVGRLMANLAEVLDGQGAKLGSVIDQAHEAVGVLRENDDDLISLASRLADLNATLATRDDELGQLIEDFNTVAATLVDDRARIDQALSGLLRLTDQVGDLLQTHRGTLQEDIETVTRVGRTLRRNLDQVSRLILYTAELYGGAEVIIERDRNWLPLLNHSGPLADYLAGSLEARLRGLCIAAGVPEEECNALPLRELIGETICIPGLITCPTTSGADAGRTVGDILSDVAEADPRLGEALRRNLEEADEDGPLRQLVGDLERVIGGDQR